MTIKLKRIYEPATKSDGKRILVDRLWPRGVSMEKAALDLWMKEVAPSHELRKAFGHDPAKWTDFKKSYVAELNANSEAVDKLRAEIGKGPATLLYGARDEEHNEAVVLKDYLDSH